MKRIILSLLVLSCVIVACEMENTDPETVPGGKWVLSEQQTIGNRIEYKYNKKGLPDTIILHNQSGFIDSSFISYQDSGIVKILYNTNWYVDDRVQDFKYENGQLSKVMSWLQSISNDTSISLLTYHESGKLAAIKHSSSGRPEYNITKFYWTGNNITLVSNYYFNNISGESLTHDIYYSYGNLPGINQLVRGGYTGNADMLKGDMYFWYGLLAYNYDLLSENAVTRRIIKEYRTNRSDTAWYQYDFNTHDLPVSLTFHFSHETINDLKETHYYKFKQLPLP